jgi:outer membrane protein OmpA-like peptidoglycan-associated protein
MLSKIGKILMAGVAVFALSSSVQAHDVKADKGAQEQKCNAGHACGSKKMVLDGRGQCVHTTDYKADKHGTVKCGDAKPPMPAPAPKPEPVVQTMTLGAHALFNHDKSDLRPEGKAELDELVSKLGQLKSVTSVEVVGHTDSSGTDEYNQGLSERRAATVKNYLESKGVSGVSARGMGESSPVASNATKEGRQQNRRVEITVTGTK